MATPITQSILPKVDFDSFLDEIGFSRQSPEARARVLDNLYMALDQEIVAQIIHKLSANEKVELLDLFEEADKTGTEIAVNEFLLDKVPDIQVIIEDAVLSIKNRMRMASAGMPAVMADQIKQFAEEPKDKTEKVKAEFEESLEEQKEEAADSDSIGFADQAVNEPNAQPEPSTDRLTGPRIPTPQPNDNGQPLFPWETPSSSSSATTPSGSTNSSNARPVIPDLEQPKEKLDMMRPFPWERADAFAAQESAPADTNEADTVEQAPLVSPTTPSSAATSPIKTDHDQATATAIQTQRSSLNELIRDAISNDEETLITKDEEDKTGQSTQALEDELKDLG